MGCPLRCPRGKGALGPLSLRGLLNICPLTRWCWGGLCAPMGTAVPLGTPVRGVTPSPTPCWAEVERGGGVGQGCGPPISTQSPVLSFSLFSTAAAQPCRARASLSRCMAPPGGYPASPRLLQSTSSRGSPWCPPQQLPTAGAFGRNGCPKGPGTSCCQAPPVLQGCPPGALCPGVAAGGCWGRRRRGPWGSVPGAHL